MLSDGLHVLFTLTGCDISQDRVLGCIEAVITSMSDYQNDVSKRRTPKYVFLFIGDGMSYPQIQATSDYLGALADEDYPMAQPSITDNQGAMLDGPVYLNFMQFPVAGSTVTFDANSFAPDSASSATSIATGNKTYAGMINTSSDGTEKFETIAEKMHRTLGMKIGIISSANLNHATPAAFYAHQAHRESFYEIGLELIESGFEYFAGGGLRMPTGYNSPRANLYDLAKESGYTVSFTNDEASSVTAKSGKVILVDEYPADSESMSYEIDRTDDMWSLADYVRKGIEVLDNDKGFFMMCEGGKIDWACHANDAASLIHEVLAFADAVQVAIDFAEHHADETLIIVTGDHETGGMSIGFAGTDYDTYLHLLSEQKISYAKFDSIYSAEYKQNGTLLRKLLSISKIFLGSKLMGKKMINWYLQRLKLNCCEKLLRGASIR